MSYPHLGTVEALSSGSSRERDAFRKGSHIDRSAPINESDRLAVEDRFHIRRVRESEQRELRIIEQNTTRSAAHQQLTASRNVNNHNWRRAHLSMTIMLSGLTSAWMMPAAWTPRKMRAIWRKKTDWVRPLTKLQYTPKSDTSYYQPGWLAQQ